MTGGPTSSGRGVIRNPDHPWNGFSGERVGTMSTPVGDGYRVRLDNGIESFVRPSEWQEGVGQVRRWAGRVRATGPASR